MAVRRIPDCSPPAVVTRTSGKTGIVLEVSGASSSSETRGEHMASFEPAYKIKTLRDRLLQQTA